MILPRFEGQGHDHRVGDKKGNITLDFDSGGFNKKQYVRSFDDVCQCFLMLGRYLLSPVDSDDP